MAAMKPKKPIKVLGGTASTAGRPAQAKISTGSMGTKSSVKITKPAEKAKVVSSNPKVTEKVKSMPTKAKPETPAGRKVIAKKAQAVTPLSKEKAKSKAPANQHLKELKTEAKRVKGLYDPTAKPGFKYGKGTM